MFHSLADFVLRHRRNLWAVTVLVVIGFLAGIAHLEVNFSVRAFFGGNDPARLVFEEVNEYWGADDRLVMVVAQSEKGPLLTPEHIKELSALEQDISELSDIDSVLSITNATRIWAPSPGLVQTEPVLDTMPVGFDAAADDPEFVAWKEVLLADPLWVPTLLSADGEATVMVLKLLANTDDMAEVRSVIKSIREVVSKHEAVSDLTYAEAGIPAVRADFFASLKHDQLLFNPIIFVFVNLTLFLVFRSIHGMIIPGIAAFLPAVMVYGLMGYTGEPIGLLNQNFFVLIPAIAVADSIHLVARFHEEIRARVGPGVRPDRTQRRAAVIEACSRIGAACLLTSLTTSVGFMSLQMAEMPVLNSFGLYAAFGIVCAYIVLLFVSPLLLVLTRGGAPSGGNLNQPTAVDRFLLLCADISVRHPRRVMAVTLLVVLAAGWMGTKVVVDNRLTSLLYDEHPTTVANGVADQQLSGVLAAQIDIQGEPGALKSPEVLQAMIALEEDAKRMSAVRVVRSPGRVVSWVTELLTGSDTISDDQGAISQFLIFVEGSTLLEDLVNLDYSRGRMIIQAQDVGANRFQKVADTLLMDMEKRFAGLPVDVVLTGTPYVAYRGVNNVTRDLRNSLMTAFIIIAIILTVLLRNTRQALICFVPNALPLVVGYGSAGLFGWDLDPTPAMVFTVALGIAVDDTIHLMVRWREERRLGLSNADAVRNAVLHTGRAVGITSIILTAGFGVFMFSSFPNMIVMGALGATVIMTAFLCDLFVLPALLVLFGVPREKASA